MKKKMDFLFVNYIKKKYNTMKKIKCYIYITKILHLYYKCIKHIDVLSKNDKIKENLIS